LRWSLLGHRRFALPSAGTSLRVPAALLRAAGIKPVAPCLYNWTHHLPPARFQARRERVAV